MARVALLAAWVAWFSWVMFCLSLPALLLARPLARCAVHRKRRLKLWRLSCALGSLILWSGVAAGGTFLAVLLFAVEKYGSPAFASLIAALVVGPLFPAVMSRTLAIRKWYWQLTHWSLDKALPPSSAVGEAKEMRLRFNQNHTLLLSKGKTAATALRKIFGEVQIVIHDSDGAPHKNN